VSEAISSLEAALGVRLLDRNAQGVEPTIYAESLLKRGQVVFDELRQGVKEIESLANPEVGEIRIACAEFLQADFVPSAIDLFAHRYPHVKFKVVPHDISSLENRELQHREVDIVLARIPRTFVHHDLNVEVLFEDPHCIVAGNSNPWTRRSDIALAELANEPWILPPSAMMHEAIRAEFESRGLQMNVSVNAASMLLRRQLLATGRYLSVLPLSLFQRESTKWRVKALKVDVQLETPPISLVTLKSRTLTPVVLRFVEHIKDVAKSIIPSAD
jgi:DNA-binding transcriptional LysR family regulator